MGDWLESEEFYNAMQRYRCAPREDQRETVAHFENVKRLLRLRFGPDRCGYPTCVDENEDERCTKWLTGECPGPSYEMGLMMADKPALLAAKQDNANPVVREGETTFLRHDEVRVIQRRPGLAAVEFRWRDTLAYTMRVDCDFASGQMLTLTGIEGRMPVRLFQN